jgi:DNA-binding NarL/FixJ family response regulator
MALTWSLVGRREELALIDRALTTTDTSGVVLAGPAGVGKTRLAREALATAESKGWVVRWAVATQAAASIPFGTVAHWLPTVDVGGMDRLDLFRRAAARLVDGAATSRVALGVDDAHLLDDMSAALVHQVAITGSAFVVVTVRSQGPVPDPIVALWKDGLAERLEVQALSRAEVNNLITAGLCGQVDGTTLHHLWLLSRGNPMLLRELILGGLDAGGLAQLAGVWRWDRPMSVAPRLLELVTARLGRLDPEERDLLEVLAFGEPLGAGLVERLVPARVLAAAERKGLLSVEQADRRVEVRPAHPLYGEMLRAQASPLRVRLIHRRLADALEAVGARRSGDLLHMVTWRLAAGETSTPAQLTVGARRAIALFDYQLAQRLARAAVDAGGGLEAEYLLGETLLALGRVGEAELIFEGLEPQGVTDQQRVRFAITRAFTLYWALNLPAKARTVLEHAQAAVTDPASGDELATIQAGLQLYSGNCTDALHAVTTTLSRPDLNDRTTLQALLVATPALFLGGRYEQAIAAGRRGLDLTQRMDDEAAAPWGRLQLSANLGNAYLAAGRLDEAETLADDAYRRALCQPWPVEKAIWAGWRGRVALARGQPRTAVQWLREAAATGQVDVPLPFMPAILGELAYAAALLGDLPTAEAALIDARRFTGESARVFQQWVALAEPWVTAARGELSTAVGLAQELAEHADARGQITFLIHALHDVVRLGQPRLAADALCRAAVGVEGSLAAVYVAHAIALATHDGPALDKAADAFASIGVMLLAAEAAAEAAHAYRQAGQRSRALAAAHNANRLAAACEDTHTPALDLLTQATGLTRREQEIASLAAQGLSSRAIAGRLFISVRTVDNNLQQVYGKLGLTSRAQLPLALNLRRPPDGSWPSK